MPTSSISTSSHTLSATLAKIVKESVDSVNILSFLVENTEKEVPISAAQAEGISSVLSSLGIDPAMVVVDGSAEDGVALHEALPKKGAVSPSSAVGETPSLLASIPSVGGGDAEPLGDKIDSQQEQKFFLKISPEAVAAAKEFYVAGQAGANWYYDANQTLAQGFPGSEEDLTLFGLLLAVTSVQNEIYGNFLEAAAMFKGIKQDMIENRPGLEQFVNDGSIKFGGKAGEEDPNAPEGAEVQGFLDHPNYAHLNTFKATKTLKVMNVGAKFGNIKSILRLLLAGQLNRQQVVSLIARSVRPDPKLSFNRRDPAIRKLKIANYALTLLDPEFAHSKNNPFNVVVDTWMFRVFFPDQTPKGGDMSQKNIGTLFSNEVAYANVATTVSDLAAEAGVSPHVMQAAIWTGIKKNWEGETADVANYVQAIRRMVREYSQLWKDIDSETQSLSQIIAGLDVEGIAKVMQNQRKDRLLGIQAKQAEDKFERARQIAIAHEKEMGGTGDKFAGVAMKPKGQSVRAKVQANVDKQGSLF